MTSTEVDTVRSRLPEAKRPERSRRVDVGGIEVAVVEWGREEDQPVALAHGGFDFAGTWDLFHHCWRMRVSGCCVGSAGSRRQRRSCAVHLGS